MRFFILFLLAVHPSARAEDATISETLQDTPVHRFYDGRHHLLTLDYWEGAGMRYEGVAFRVLSPADARPGDLALYRCYLPNTGDHFVSSDPYCEGRYQEGLYGYALRNQYPGTAPLYRCYNAWSGDHLSTINTNECYRGGYRVENLQGYVFAP